MGQKSNPTSLRLERTNKHFNSSWYSDIFYTVSLEKDLKLNAYLLPLFGQLRYPAPLLLTQSLYKRWRGYILFFNPFRSRSEKGGFFHLESSQMYRITKTLSKDKTQTERGDSLSGHQPAIKSLSPLLQGMFPFLVPFQKANSSLSSAISSEGTTGSGISTANDSGEATLSRVEKQRYLHSLLLTSSLRRIQNRQINPKVEALRFDIQSLLSSSGSKGSGISASAATTKRVSKPSSTFGEVSKTGFPSSPAFLPTTQPAFGEIGGDRSPTMAHLESTFGVDGLQHKRGERSVEKGSKLRHSAVELHTMRAVWEGQSAHLLAEEIIYYLEKRVSFRRIKYQIVREMERDPNIRGIRVNCSGRLGGRSKKAQKAKTESIQWGQTSLHVFSSKLSYSSKSGTTPFGKISVKVWICYA